MRGIGLGFAMGLSMVTMYAKGPINMPIWWKILPFVLDFPIIPIDKKLLTYKEQDNWVPVHEIGTNDIITYDATETIRYGHSELVADFVVTKWPPSQWYRKSRMQSYLIYIQKVDSESAYQVLEQEAIKRFPQDEIEFMVKNNSGHDFLKVAGFKSYGIFLSKEIAKSFVAPVSNL